MCAAARLLDAQGKDADVSVLALNTEGRGRMRFSLNSTLCLRVAALTMALVAAHLSAGADEAQFLAENRAAMERMMAGMEVKPSGDADRDFAAMMIPHHQGAIDMAQAELRYGRNEQLRRIAQEIIVEQQ